MPNSIFSVGTMESAGPLGGGQKNSVCVCVGVKREYVSMSVSMGKRVYVSVFAAVRENANEWMRLVCNALIAIVVSNKVMKRERRKERAKERESKRELYLLKRICVQPVTSRHLNANEFLIYFTLLPFSLQMKFHLKCRKDSRQCSARTQAKHTHTPSQ